jgi:hypothetical protein
MGSIRKSKKLPRKIAMEYNTVRGDMSGPKIAQKNRVTGPKIAVIADIARDRRHPKASGSKSEPLTPYQQVP